MRSDVASVLRVMGLGWSRLCVGSAAGCSALARGQWEGRSGLGHARELVLGRGSGMFSAGQGQSGDVPATRGLFSAPCEAAQGRGGLVSRGVRSQQPAQVTAGRRAWRDPWEGVGAGLETFAKPSTHS